jgi:hypothetical protein
MLNRAEAQLKEDSAENLIQCVWIPDQCLHPVLFGVHERT